ncbi:hypothetical protein HMPREF0083_05053 [Aneurinibacillus aneurinilyticus ATCC 12856]|uniref:Uncharacterized protein n=1 Tax=Aneurinibacillus aneurinilyticus ATCC 12856 TaxID=649747 RepID=U1Y7W3_ANEAE|nr:hypothetical protein HMPREF0083_05053 [Aneurinibacillus aneurinilyticus ATCC 12856]
MIIHKVEERRCTRRRVPSSFSRGRDTAPGATKRPSELGCGRRTDARLGHGVMAIHSGSYWIINTLDIIYKLHLIF